MQPARILLLAGAVTAGAIGLAALAHAGDDAMKTLTLQLPGGQVEQIRYSGPVAPQVMVVPMGMPTMPMAAPAATGPFAPQDPFAQLAQMSAMMNQQAAAMMQAMQVMTAAPMPGPGLLIPAGMGMLPSGSSGFCMQSVEITSNGQGAPHIVQHSAGNCGGANGAAAATPVPFGRPSAAIPAVDRHVAPSAPATPKLLRVRDTQPLEVPRASQS